MPLKVVQHGPSTFKSSESDVMPASYKKSVEDSTANSAQVKAESPEASPKTVLAADFTGVELDGETVNASIYVILTTQIQKST